MAKAVCGFVYLCAKCNASYEEIPTKGCTKCHCTRFVTEEKSKKDLKS
jgi:hypothetical protein